MGDTIGGAKRALRAAHVVPSDVKVVLLVGGLVCIPLVAQTVGAEIGRPVAIDVHPKHAVALGAALAADVAHRGPQPATEPTALAAAAAVVAAPAAPIPATPTPDAAPPASPAAGPAVGAPTLIGAAPSPSPATSSAPSTAAPGPPSRPGPASTPPPSGPAPGGRGDGAGGKRLGLVVAAGCPRRRGGRRGGRPGRRRRRRHGGRFAVERRPRRRLDLADGHVVRRGLEHDRPELVEHDRHLGVAELHHGEHGIHRHHAARRLRRRRGAVRVHHVGVRRRRREPHHPVQGVRLHRQQGHRPAYRILFPNNPKIQADILNAGASGPDQAEWVLWGCPTPSARTG